MWPWEHLALGYLCASALLHSRYRVPPTDSVVVLVVVGTQLPDLVDKPLAWWLAVLPSGTSLGHSLLFLVFASAIALVVTGRRGDGMAGVAFSVALASHLLGDMLFWYATDGRVIVDFLFWPLVPAHSSPSIGFVGTVRRLFAAFLSFLSTPRGLVYLSADVALVGGALVVWMVDGFPGLSLLRRSVSTSDPDPPTE